MKILPSNPIWGDLLDLGEQLKEFGLCLTSRNGDWLIYRIEDNKVITKSVTTPAMYGFITGFLYGEDRLSKIINYEELK